MTRRNDTKMFSAFEWMLAFRYLRARRQEGFISVVAVFSFIGILLGVALLIVVISVLNGQRNEFLSKILGVKGHFVVQKAKDPFTDYIAASEKLRQIPGVISVLPVVESEVMVSSNDQRTAALVRGISETDLMQIKKITDNLNFGTINNFDAGVSVLIGARMANILGVNVNNALSVLTPRGASTFAGILPRSKDYAISGIFQVGVAQYDNEVIIMPLSEAQKFFSLPNQVTGIELMVSDPYNLDQMRSAISQVLGEGYVIADWQKQNAALFGAMKVERNMTFIVVFIVLLVAIFNIVSGVIMLVKEKGRDIAVLRTMGASRAAIMRVFLITGASIGITGTLCGFLLGYAICANMNSIQMLVSYLMQSDFNNETLNFLARLPVKMDPVETAIIVGASLSLSILATLYPSWRAAQMDPVEALRYE